MCSAPPTPRCRARRCTCSTAPAAARTTPPGTHKTDIVTEVPGGQERQRRPARRRRVELLHRLDQGRSGPGPQQVEDLLHRGTAAGHQRARWAPTASTPSRACPPRAPRCWSWPIAKPGLYRSVAAYSGCAQTSDPVGPGVRQADRERLGRRRTSTCAARTAPRTWAAQRSVRARRQAARGEAVHLHRQRAAGHLRHPERPVRAARRRRAGQSAASSAASSRPGSTTARTTCTKLTTLGIPATYNFPPTRAPIRGATGTTTS